MSYIDNGYESNGFRSGEAASSTWSLYGHYIRVVTNVNRRIFIYNGGATYPEPPLTEVRTDANGDFQFDELDRALSYIISDLGDLYTQETGIFLTVSDGDTAADNRVQLNMNAS